MLSLPLLLALPVLAQVPDTGTHHDRRSSYMELALSANTGYPDAFRLQLELMLKHRGWPLFLSGRVGGGTGNWGGHACAIGTTQLAAHWTRDGDDSWAFRVGWVMGERLESSGSNWTCDTLGCGYARSNLLGNTFAIERTAYFPRFRDFAWRASVGVATAWHRYEFRGSPIGEKTDIVSPFADVGVLWVSF